MSSLRLAPGGGIPLNQSERVFVLGLDKKSSLFSSLVLWEKILGYARVFGGGCPMLPGRHTDKCEMFTAI